MVHQAAERPVQSSGPSQRVVAQRCVPRSARVVHLMHGTAGNVQNLFQDALEYNLRLSREYGTAVRMYGLYGVSGNVRVPATAD